MKEYRAGFSFNISLPDYMSKTIGLNDAASIQYKSDEKDVYGFVVIDTKEELELAELKFESINLFYDQFIVDFLKDEKKRSVSKPLNKKVGESNFIEVDVSYYDTDAKTEIYYLVGVVETKKAYYKVLTWTTLAARDSFKTDFQKILYSIKD